GKRRGQGRGEGLRVALAEGHAAWTDGFGQPARIRCDHRAAAGDPFERDDSERFLPDGGYDHDPAAVKKPYQLFATRGSVEGDLCVEFQSLGLSPQHWLFRAAADDEEGGRGIPFPKLGERID